VAIPTPLDHVLVVSRNYLPLNFYGARDAIFDRESGADIYGTAFYPGSISNDQILRWLYLQLLDLLPSLPRPDEEKGLLGTNFVAMPNSVDNVDLRRRQSGEIFISYRSYDHKGVEALKRKIEGDRRSGLFRRVRYFPPGLLSDEILTEQRRWQLLSMIDRFIGPASEIWIYETENYYDSWWTLGELATLAYRREEGYRKKSPPKLRIYDPKTETVRDAPPDYLPVMTTAQCRRMARWFSNSDTAQTGPESLPVMRLLQFIPLVRRFKYIQDHVWSDEFWRHPILDCKVCRQIGKDRNRFDVEAFLWTQYKGISRFTPEEMNVFLERGEVICLACKTAYPFVESLPHYLWMRVIHGHRTGEYLKVLFDIEADDPDEFSLLPLPTWRLVDHFK
jgi:uncharacterized protein YbaR (Trm112 family)